MPRETDGTYTLPTGTVTPAVTNTPISSADFNALVNDIAATLEDSLSRTGDGGMLVPLKFSDGTDAAPGITFDSDTDTGLFRDTANELAVTAGGTESARFTAAGVEIPGTLDVTGNVTVVGTITETGRAPMQESVDSTVFSHTGDTTETAVTGPGPSFTPLSVTLTTTGRPVLVGLQSVDDSGAFGSYLGTTADAGGARLMIVRIKRDGTTISEATLLSPASTLSTWPGYMRIDVPSAAAHTYTVTIQMNNNAATGTVNYMKLVAYEL